jgi:hypothetical protein
MRRGAAGMDETTHINQYSGSTPTYPAHRRHHRFQRNNPTVIGQVKHLARSTRLTSTLTGARGTAVK